jgi:5'-AMP-activated protein kinase regulatory gamma subunit
MPCCPLSVAKTLSDDVARLTIPSFVQTLVRLGVYQNLDLTISSALKQRPHDFPGVITCTPGDSLASLLLLIQRRRVHRLVVVEGAEGRKGRLVGIITLSDILKYLIGADEVPRTGAQIGRVGSGSNATMEVPEPTS